MASGLEGQRFRFVGYLPAQSAERRRKVVEIESESASRDETQLFIETPYRNDALLADVIDACRDDTRLAVAADLTGKDEWIRSDEVRAWKSRAATIGKRPAVFLLLARPRGKR
jgi:16S rRNA (cytidine1402-2'-O)-methyltransferase